MNNEKFKKYMVETISLLKKQAIEAKKEADHAKRASKDYSKGEFMAYCSTISLLKDQALTFHLDEKELGLT